MIQACDFSRSFLTFRVDSLAQPSITQSSKPNHTVNNARIQIDCICELTRPDGRKSTYVLGAACKTERVNVAEDIWTQPNANFCLTVSDDEFLVIKKYDHCGRRVMAYPSSQGEQPHRQSGFVRDAYAKLSVDIRRRPGRELSEIDTIIEAAFANKQLVAVTSWTTDDGYDVRLEYPVRTINIGDREKFYQTDTGPILFPQTNTECELLIECFQLAFIAVNSPDWAELLVNDIVTVDETKVQHYSRPHRIACQNSLLAFA
ncbi:MAG: hypothetical protein VB878_13785 [Pirellulaceae bacterium]